MLAKIGKFLTTRFPEKCVVSVEGYMGLHAEVSALRSKLTELEQQVTAHNTRLSVVESSAVHKGAVSDLVNAVKLLKEDYATFKANTIGSKPLSEAEIQSLYNGEYLNGKGS